MGKFSFFGLKSNAPLVNNDCKSSGCNECGCGKSSVEFADEITYNNNTKGVTFTTIGDKVKLTYNGLLSKNGANEVFAVIGFGDNNDWKDVSTYPMNITNQQMYELSIPAEDSGQLNVAFKDGTNNWDNNQGKNYSFYIQ